MRVAFADNSSLVEHAVDNLNYKALCSELKNCGFPAIGKVRVLMMHLKDHLTTKGCSIDDHKSPIASNPKSRGSGKCDGASSVENLHTPKTWKHSI